MEAVAKAGRGSVTWRPWSMAVLGMGMLLVPCGAQAAEARSLAGTWIGAILFQEGQIELDMKLELRQKDGRWSAVIDLPQVDVEALEVAETQVDGDSFAIRFDIDDGAGLRELKAQRDPAPSGAKATAARPDVLHGTFAQTPEKQVPLYLERQPAGGAAPAEARPIDLGAGAAELRARFNQDLGKVRLVLLLSPSCSLCRMGSRVVQRHVLKQVDAPDLAVYYAWLPIHEVDDLKFAAASASAVADPRLTHFWDGPDTLTKAFKAPIGLTEGKAWNVYLVYGRDAKWGDVPPKPLSFMHQRLPLAADRVLDARKLADEVRAALVGKKGTVTEFTPRIR